MLVPRALRSLVLVTWLMASCWSWELPLKVPGPQPDRKLGRLSFLQVGINEGFVLEAGTPLTLNKAVGYGSYGTVFLGKLGNEESALKVPVGEDPQDDSLKDYYDTFVADTIEEAELIHRLMKHNAGEEKLLESFVHVRGVGFIDMSAKWEEMETGYKKASFRDLFEGEHTTESPSGVVSKLQQIDNIASGKLGRQSEVIAEYLYEQKLFPVIAMEVCPGTLDSPGQWYHLGTGDLTPDKMPTPSGVQTATYALVNAVLHGVKYMGTSSSTRKWALHRDLKPENVLICDGKAKIADFGTLAFFDEELISDDDIERANEVAGSRDWMPPEVVLPSAGLTDVDIGVVENEWHLGYDGHLDEPSDGYKARTMSIIDRHTPKPFSSRDMWAVGMILYRQLLMISYINEPLEYVLSSQSLVRAIPSSDKYLYTAEAKVGMCVGAKFHGEKRVEIVWQTLYDMYGMDSPILNLLKKMLACNIAERISPSDALAELENSEIAACEKNVDALFCKRFMKEKISMDVSPLVVKNDDPTNVKYLTSADASARSFCSGCKCNQRFGDFKESQENVISYEFTEECTSEQRECCVCGGGPARDMNGNTFTHFMKDAAQICNDKWAEWLGTQEEEGTDGEMEYQGGSVVQRFGTYGNGGYGTVRIAHSRTNDAEDEPPAWMKRPLVTLDAPERQLFTFKIRVLEAIRAGDHTLQCDDIRNFITGYVDAHHSEFGDSWRDGWNGVLSGCGESTESELFTEVVKQLRADQGRLCST